MYSIFSPQCTSFTVTTTSPGGYEIVEVAMLSAALVLLCDECEGGRATV